MKIILFFPLLFLLSSSHSWAKNVEILIGEGLVEDFCETSSRYTRDPRVRCVSHGVAEFTSPTGYYEFIFEGSWSEMDQFILEDKGGLHVTGVSFFYRKKDGSLGKEKYLKKYTSLIKKGSYKGEPQSTQQSVLLRPSLVTSFYNPKETREAYKHEIVKVTIKVRANNDNKEVLVGKPMESNFKLFLRKSDDFKNFLAFQKASKEENQRDLKEFFKKEHSELFGVFKILVMEHDLLDFKDLLNLLSEILKKDQNLKNLKKYLVREKYALFEGRKEKKLEEIDRLDSENLIHIKRQVAELFAAIARKEKEEEAIKKMRNLLALGFTPDRRSYERAIVEGKDSLLAFLFSFPEEFPALKDFKLEKDQGHYGSFLHLAVATNQPAAARVILEKRPDEYQIKDDREPQSLLQKKHATPEERLAEHWNKKAFHEMRQVFKKFNRKMKQEARARKKAEKEKN